MKLVPAIKTYDLNVETIDTFGGLNQKDQYSNFEFVDMENLSSGRFPLISIRPSRAVAYSLTSGKALFSDGVHLCWVDGTNFVYNGNIEGTVTASAKSMVEFNKYIVIFPDKKAYNTVGDSFAAFTCAYTLDHIAVYMNRIFGVGNQAIHSCKQGDHTIWDDFSGDLNDSWATDVPGFGNFTGVAAYQNHVIMQSSDMMHELYGYKPSNFNVIPAAKVGAFHKSYAEINSVLYFASKDGIYQYTGGIPRLISGKLGYSIDNAVGGTDKEKYYVSITSGTDHHLLVYDPKYDVWHREDDLNVIDFAYLDGFLYALADDNKIYKFNSGTESISFSGKFTETYDGDMFKDKTAKSIEILADVPSGATLNIYFVEGATETLIKSVAGTTMRAFRIPINIRAEKYQIKFTGTGNVAIRAIKRISIGGGL